MKIQPLTKEIQLRKTKSKKKPKTKGSAWYRKECDKIYQEIGRKLYNCCLVCNGEYSTLHHYVRKAQSTELRYDIENGIPICAKCHCKIHTGQDGMTTAKIAMIKGKEWLDNLETKQRLGVGKYFGIGWWKAQYERLKIINK